jgi:hypothetical protein
MTSAPRSKRNDSLCPQARKVDLVTRQIPGELLIYDLKRHKAFCLNDTAATIWKNCNGKRTVAELAAELQRGTPAAIDERLVWLGLEQLEKSHLLQASSARPAHQRGVSRRQLIRYGIATAVALPLVTMVAAPTAQAAASLPDIPLTMCQNRKPTDPGGCGGNACSDVPDTFCVALGSKCRCR